MNTDRKVVPIHTGRVQIGLAYQPKLRPEHSHAGSRHLAPRRSGVGRWVVWSVLAVVAMVLIAGRA